MKYYRYNKYRNKERAINMLNKKQFDKVNKNSEANGYEFMVGMLIFILSLIVGFVYMKGNYDMYSGFRLVGLALLGQVVFWLVTYVSKKIVQ